MDICTGYDKNSIHQLEKKDNSNGAKYKIYPLTYVQAVYDARNGRRLDTLLDQCNSIYVYWKGSVEQTRLALPMFMRRKGIIITYRNAEDEVITEKNIYDDCIADDVWGLDAYWVRITDALPITGNVTIGSNGNWFVNGEDTGFKAQGPKGENGLPLQPRLSEDKTKIEFTYDGNTWYELFPLTLVTPTIDISETVALEPGATPTVANVGDDFNVNLEFSLPKAPEVNVGSTTTIGEGNRAKVTNSGTKYAPVLNFEIPKGDTGRGINIKGFYPDLPTLQEKITEPAIGDVYCVGSAEPYEGYVWTNVYSSETQSSTPAWQSLGEINKDTTIIVNDLGDREDVAMSQKGVTDIIKELDDKINKGNFLFSSGSTPDANPAIKELYIMNSLYDKVSLISVASSKVRITISDSSETLEDASMPESDYEPDKIYELRTSNSQLMGYVIFTGTEISYSGNTVNIEKPSYQQYNSPIIQSFLTESIDIVSNRQLSSNITFNLNVKELYIDTVDKDSEFTISLFRLNMTDQSYTDLVYIQKNGVNFANVFISDLVADTIYSMDILDGSNSKAYIIFSDYSKDTINSSGIKWVLNKEFIFSYSQNPTIESHVINSLIPTENYTPKWTTNLEWNKYIKELYIPNANEKFGSCGIVTLGARKDKCSIVCSKNDGEVIGSAIKNVTKEYYMYNSISPLYKDQDKEIFGWVIFNYLGEDFSVSGSVRLFNLDVVENIENSPTIAKMLNSDKQIILTGESLQGQPQNNSLPDILRGMTGNQVWNISCGGCRMAWRTVDGSNYYDKFSFSNLMESISKNDFSEQLNAVSGEMPTDFRIQYNNMLQIDPSKETIIICNYMSNDITGDNQIGELWEYTDIDSNYDRQTFLGAMNYGISKILTQYPLFKFVFMGNFFRKLAPNLEGDRTQPPYYWTNGIGKKASDYVEAEKENCSRIGLPFYNAIFWGIRNNFSLDSVTTDGTHFNAYGFLKYAQLIKSLLY